MVFAHATWLHMSGKKGICGQHARDHANFFVGNNHYANNMFECVVQLMNITTWCLNNGVRAMWAARIGAIYGERFPTRIAICQQPSRRVGCTRRHEQHVSQSCVLKLLCMAATVGNWKCQRIATCRAKHVFSERVHHNICAFSWLLFWFLLLLLVLLVLLSLWL